MHGNEVKSMYMYDGAVYWPKSYMYMWLSCMVPTLWNADITLHLASQVTQYM